MSFHVRAADREGALLAYEALPMHAVREGYRAIRLRSPTGSRLQHGTLFVHLSTHSRVVDAAVCAPRKAKRSSLGRSSLASSDSAEGSSTKMDAKALSVGSMPQRTSKV